MIRFKVHNQTLFAEEFVMHLFICATPHTPTKILYLTGIIPTKNPLWDQAGNHLSPG
jgi:hypothetical protein